MSLSTSLSAWESAPFDEGAAAVGLEEFSTPGRRATPEFGPPALSVAAEVSSVVEPLGIPSGFLDVEKEVALGPADGAGGSFGAEPSFGLFTSSNSASIVLPAGTMRSAALMDLNSDTCRFSTRRRRAMQRWARRGFSPTSRSQGSQCPCAMTVFAASRASPSSQASCTVRRTDALSACACFFTRLTTVWIPELAESRGPWFSDSPGFTGPLLEFVFVSLPAADDDDGFSRAACSLCSVDVDALMISPRHGCGWPANPVRCSRANPPARSISGTPEETLPDSPYAREWSRSPQQH